MKAAAKIDESMMRDLEELEDILQQFDEVSRVRNMECQDVVNEFIATGQIQKISDSEGLYLITQAQLDSFYASIKAFNSRVDSTVSRMNAIEAKTKQLYQQLESTKFTLQQTINQKLRLEEIIKEMQQHSMTASNSSGRNAELNSGQVVLKGQSEQLQFRVRYLEQELRNRDTLIRQLESKMDVEVEAIISRQSQDESSGQNYTSNIQQTMQQRIDQLEKQVEQYQTNQGTCLDSITKGISEKVLRMEEQIAKNQLLFIEEEAESFENIAHEISSSNSRGLHIMGLQRELSAAREHLKEVQKQFEEYRRVKEQQIADLQTQKVDVAEYQKQLEGFIGDLQTRLSRYVIEQIGVADVLQRHENEVNLLKLESDQVKNKLAESEKKAQADIEEKEDKLSKLEQELAMKNDIIRWFDPMSDEFVGQRQVIEEQKERITELTCMLERIQSNESERVAQLLERIERVEEQNKILTCIVEEKKEDNQVDFYRKKYQEMDLKYGMLVAQTDTDKRRLVVENAKLKQQMKQIQAVGKNKRVADRLTVSEGVKVYQPLSEDIQKMIDLNSQQKNEIVKLSVEIASLRQDNSQLREIIQNLITADQSPNRQDDDDEVEGFSDQQSISLNEHLFLIQTLAHSQILKEL